MHKSCDGAITNMIMLQEYSDDMSVPMLMLSACVRHLIKI